MDAAEVAALAMPAAVTVLLWARWRRDARATLVTKALASGLFLVIALAASGGAADHARAVRVGLALCAVGDLCLVSESRRALGAGIVAFGLGHVALSIAFAPRARLDVALALCAALAIGAGAVLWRVRARLGPLAAPAALYALAVSATAALGVAAWSADLGGPGRALVGAGAVLFFASDLAVARQRFATDSFVNRAVGVPLYYAATTLLALSVSRVA